MFFLFSHYDIKTSIRIFDFPPNLLESKKAKYFSKLRLQNGKWVLSKQSIFNKSSVLIEKKPKTLKSYFSELTLFTIQLKKKDNIFNSIKTNLPQWRATQGFGKSQDSQRFYQSEIFFAPKGSSCLSFIPRINNKNIKKRELWIINASLEGTYETSCSIKFFESNGEEVGKDIFPMRTNAANLYKIPSKFICKDAVLIIKNSAAIPLIMDFSKNDIHSIEHTHPSPSFFAPNTRDGIGKSLKRLWNSDL